MRLLSLVPVCLLVAACDQPINLFTIEDDIELGKQLRDEINSDSENFAVVDPADAPEAYGHLERMVDSVLASGKVVHEKDFAWEIYLIDDDETLNAFAAPGGYMWVYSGLIRFLDREDDLVGVLGHELAHADRRHSTNQLTKAYGASVLLGVLFGDEPGLIPQIANSLLQLSFSRSDETEADAFSVEYLCETPYASNGAATFFEKLLADSTIEIPEFLSTHPSSDTRVQDINALATELGCSTEANSTVNYQDVIDSLP